MANQSPSRKSSLPSQITSWRNTLGLSKRGLNGFVSVSPAPLPPGLSPLPKLPDLPPLLKFPLKSSPEDSLQTADVPGPSNGGLFAALIGDPLVLYQHYLEHPEQFEEETIRLLMELVTRRKSVETLSQAEKKLLDQATVSFAQHSPSSSDSHSARHNVPSLPQSSTDPEQPDPEEIVWEGDAMKLSPSTMFEPIDIPEISTKWWDKGPGGSLR